jgi:hypothetical protein
MLLLKIFDLSFSEYYEGLIVPATILIPLGIAIFNYSYLNKSLKILLAYLIVSGLINLWAIIHSDTNNLYFLHIYTIAEFILLMDYFISINKSKSIPIFSYVILLAFPLFGIINMEFFQSKFQFNSYVRPIESLIFIFYCILCFFGAPEENIHQSWKENSFNWINAGLLIYFSSSLFLFAFSNFFSKLSLNSQMVIWDFHATTVTVLYIFIALGFSKCKKSPTTFTY